MDSEFINVDVLIRINTPFYSISNYVVTMTHNKTTIYETLKKGSDIRKFKNTRSFFQKKNLCQIESPRDVNKVTLPSKFDVAMGYQTLLVNLTASAPIALSDVYVTFYFRCLSSGHC